MRLVAAVVTLSPIHSVAVSPARISPCVTGVAAASAMRAPAFTAFSSTRFSVSAAEVSGTVSRSVPPTARAASTSSSPLASVR